MRLAVLLMGAFSPFVGNVSDRFGTARTVASGGVLYVIGMFMIAFATEGVMLTVGNVLCGVGMSAAGFGPIFGSISRQTPPEKRSVALGVATAGGSFGQFAIVPFASLLQYRLDNWHTTMLILGVMSMMMVPLAFGLREHRARTSKVRRSEPARRKRCAAGGLPDLWLLVADRRLLRVRVPCVIYWIALPLVHFR